MFTLNLSVRAILLHDGAVLLRERCAPEKGPDHAFLGGGFQLGHSYLECCVHAVDRQAGLAVVPEKLLYVVEHFHGSGNKRSHDLCMYYLVEPCEPLTGNLLDALHPEDDATGKLVLVPAAKINDADLQPAALREILAGDALSDFHVSTKHIVINELPRDVDAESGAFRL